MTLFLLLCAAGFMALGIWQVERRSWKHALIASVDARIKAAPLAAPGRAEWPGINAKGDAYRRVTVTGHFVPGRPTLTKAVTELGPGYWLMEPFDTGRFVVLVNRGFVPTSSPACGKGQGRACNDWDDRRASPSHRPTPDVVTGLLRVTEPGGGFLRTNDPNADRWYSRDVAAIAQARRLGPVAPYFIDADASHNAPGQPVGGLTVVRFADNHLVYALTWFGMALLCLWALWRLRSAR